MISAKGARLTLVEIKVTTPAVKNQGPFFAFTDSLDVIDDRPLVVKAKISLVPENQGGRHGPFTKGFRPNHNFGGPQDAFFFIGQIEVPENEWVFPGETRDLLVTFLNVRGLKEKLVPNQVWRIQEGPKLVGTGTVIELMK